jgi:hypothetical protein
MPFNATSPAVSAVARFLPQAALDVFCKAASEAEQAKIDHNGCIRQGWAAVKSAGWEAPATGKKWVFKDDGGTTSDGPGAGDVHVDVPLGAGKKPPKRKPYGEDVEKFETTAQVFKVDDSLGLVFGWAIVCKIKGEPYFDLQCNQETGEPEPDHIPEHSMLKAAADFMQNSRVAKDMHRGSEIGPVVFAWPLTTDIAKAMNIQCDTTGLMIAMMPPPDILAKYRSGEYTGFSIGGWRVEDEEVAA